MDIAIIGMAGRFPGAADTRQLWANLVGGEQGYTVTPADGAGTRLDIDTRFCDIRLFEPDFFRISDGEARMLDPQHRILLECAHEALEDAGYDPGSCSFPIGVFAGSGFNHYFVQVIAPTLTPQLADGDDPALVLMANEKDFLATRVSYRLGLRGPGVTVQTGCSTSLVAVHLACQSLRMFESDLCLAGGVSIHCGPDRSHIYREGGILSRDGRCRPFDADATGTTFADGAALIVLKRMDAAVRDRDDVYAVIKGTTVNNDGATKVGYTAPSVEQYAALVEETQAVAGIDADSIGFLEAHGTGTHLGDAVEIRALTDAFRKTTARPAFCALGSVKSQVGHLDVAAGVTGLIKTALALRHRLIPPTLHFETPNPALADSPFFVNTRPLPWTDAAAPRRAAVSSLGIGGTNAHAILEEAPRAAPAASSSGPYLLVLSARSELALDRVADRLRAHLRDNVTESLARIACTLQVGRHRYPHRLAFIAFDMVDASARLDEIVSTGRRIDVFVRPGGEDEPLMRTAQAYLAGEAIDWDAVWNGKPPGRAHLPTYPFERRTFWFRPRRTPAAAAPADAAQRTDDTDPAQASPATPLAETSARLYTPHWTRVSEPPASRAMPQGDWVFIGPDRGLAMESARALEALGLRAWRGSVGTTFCTSDERSATLDLSNEQQVKAFLRWLRSSVGRPERVVFDPTSTLDAIAETGTEEPELLRVGRLARLLCEAWPRQPLDLLVLTARASELTVRIGDLPSTAPVIAAAIVAAAEYPALRIRCLDVAEPGTVLGGMPQPGKRFLNELLREEGSDLAAFAGGYVWERDYAAVSRVDPRPLLDPDGVYLITGGLGGVGLELADYLAAKGPVRLALVTRRRFVLDAAASVDGDTEVHLRLARIEQTGARVRVFSADAASLDEMRNVAGKVEAPWGRVNGVFHAAGLAGGALMHNASSPELTRVCTPKGGGAQVLARVFAGRDLDFLLLFSSTASVFPAIGQLEYCAANTFLDVLAPVLRRDYGIAAYSVNWPHWVGVGMAARVDTSPFVEIADPAERPDGLSRAEVRSFLDAWAAGGWPAQVVITRLRPESRVHRTSAGAIDEETSVDARTPDEVAATVKGLWVDLLGYADIGEDVDFFDRGGDSIMAVQLIGRFRKAFRVDYSFDRFFAAPTIRDMVAFVTDAASPATHHEHAEDTARAR